MLLETKEPKKVYIYRDIGWVEEMDTTYDRQWKPCVA